MSTRLKQYYTKLLLSVCLLATTFKALAADDLSGAATVSGSAAGSYVAVILSPLLIIPSAIGSVASIQHMKLDPEKYKAADMEAFLKDDDAVILTHIIPLENGQRYVLKRPSDQEAVMFDVTDPNFSAQFDKVPLNTLIAVEKEDYGILLINEHYVLALFPNENGKKLITLS